MKETLDAFIASASDFITTAHTPDVRRVDDRLSIPLSHEQRMVCFTLAISVECVYVCMSVYVCLNVCMYINIYVRMYVCMYICLYVHVYMRVCILFCVRFEYIINVLHNKKTQCLIIGYC